MNVKERADTLRRDLRAAMEPLLAEFTKDTGVVICGLSTTPVDVSTAGQPGQFIMGAIRLEVRL